METSRCGATGRWSNRPGTPTCRRRGRNAGVYQRPRRVSTTAGRPPSGAGTPPAPPPTDSPRHLDRGMAGEAIPSARPHETGVPRRGAEAIPSRFEAIPSERAARRPPTPRCGRDERSSLAGSGPRGLRSSPGYSDPRHDLPHRAHPQLRDHRPRRPRKVDVGRPHAAGDRARLRARHACPVPRQDGHRARARDHHQGAGRPDAVQVQGRRGVPAEPDRHARPRRLLLRGVAGHERVRGRDPARRRGPGHGGADDRQPLPGDRRGAGGHPRPQQDRSARRPARGSGQGDLCAARRGARGHPQGLGKDRHRCARGARAGRRPRAPAQRRPRGRRR